MNLADVLVGGQGALAPEFDFEDQPVLLRHRFIERELHGKIPGGICAAVSVDGSLGFLIAGE